MTDSIPSTGGVGQNRELECRHGMHCSRTILLLAVLATLGGCAGLRLSEAERLAFWQLEDDAIEQSGAEEVCHLHRVPTEVEFVPVEDGLCVEWPRYMRAKVRRFPNSFLSVSSCVCDPMGPPGEVPRSVCPRCREAEERWRARHGW